jgi:hypothetical protein
VELSLKSIDFLRNIYRRFTGKDAYLKLTKIADIFYPAESKFKLFRIHIGIPWARID